MKHLNLLSLPHIWFAHVFESNEYHAHLTKREHNIEVTCITEGELFLTQNGQTYHAKSGDIICNLYGADLQVDSNAYHQHHTVCFWVDFELTDRDETELPEVPFITHSSDASTECLRLIDDMIQAHALYPENRLKVIGLFLQLLNEIGNINRRCRRDCSPGEYHYVRKAKKYIYDHITEPILQKNLAAYLGITPEYLCSIFKKSESCSVIRFINHIKLNHICTLMEKEQIPLNQAAFRYGFSDPNYVSRLYKKYYGTSITEAITKKA